MPAFDWRKSPMGQSNPEHLGKIKKNIEDLKSLLKEEDTLLDAGCFRGHLFGEIRGLFGQGRHPKYHGIDLVQDNVDEAKKTFADNQGCSFEQKDILELEGEWDVIFCARVLMHLPPWEEAIKRMRSCAKRHLILAVPLGGYIAEYEDHGGEKVLFQKFHPSQFEGARLIKHPQYATVIYG